MRTLAGVACALALAVGCGKKSETKPASGSGSAPPPVAAAADAAAAPTPKNDYETHFEAGEALEDQKKWSEALVEFEAALAAKPNDARALNEVGFNATFAGKLDRAKEAGISAIAAATGDKTLHAQALFNLGLAVEPTSARRRR